jgi:hypothetical protein
MYREVIHDPKLRKATPDQRWLWVTVLCLADDDGIVRLADGVPYESSDLADLAGISVEEVTAGLDHFERMAMIERGPAAIVILKWNSRQFKGDSSTERVRAFREKQKNNDVKRCGNVSVTPPEHILQSRTYKTEQSREDKDTTGAATNDIAAPATPPGDSKPLLIFPVDGKTNTWDLLPAKVAELHDAFPSLDILGEAKKALGWVNADRARKKTAGGMPKFLFGWMSRAQNNGGGQRGATANVRQAAQRAGLDDERRKQFADMDRELNEKGVIGETDQSG